MKLTTSTVTVLTPDSRRALARKLLAWFRKSARDLPWRRTSDLYAIWVSEVMLQQTQVATVIPYYQRFLAAFPNVASLASADEEQVLRLWEGLGYYRRARQMHAAARQVVAEHDGRFPSTYSAVRALPGIGRYTAGAILSIGLDQRLPILEANTIRVLSRLAAYRGDPAGTTGQKHLWTLAEALLPARDVGAFNQALMELGSEVCTPKNPACGDCPISTWCGAYAQGVQDQIPGSSPKKSYEEITEIAVVIRRGRKVLVRQCQLGERWAGLWDFPRFAKADDESIASQSIASQVRQQTGVHIELGPLLTRLKHGVTRFRITLECYEAEYAGQAIGSTSTCPTRWLTADQLAELPLSATGRKIARAVTPAGK